MKLIRWSIRALRPTAYAAALLLFCAVDAAGDDDLLDVDLESLSEITITSVSRKEQKLTEAPAAVFVISSEDIRRSGATTIPDVLRMAPGVHVARIDSNKWAVSARGLTDRFAYPLLVLIDGRVVYNPLFSGVFWDLQDTLIEDIERIEVIRGSGATLWGANAVNGVINIITKKSYATKGALLTAGAGDLERSFASARWGDRLEDGTAYRGYVKWFERDGMELLDIAPRVGSADDAWHGFQSGFRVDAEPGLDDQLTVQGDALRHSTGLLAVYEPNITAFLPEFEGSTTQEAANLLGRWTRTLARDSDVQVLAYYDYVRRDEDLVRFSQHTLDFDLQHRFQPLQGHDVIWGGEYRYYIDDTEGTYVLTFDPASRQTNLFTAFVQDEVTLSEKLLRLIAGTKFEHNDYTGLEVQPNARLLFTPNERNSFWLAASRAVRTPSAADEEVNFLSTVPIDQTMGNVPIVVRGLGNKQSEAVSLYSTEIGYRTQIRENLSVDTALFYNYYDDMNSGELDPTPAFRLVPAPHIEFHGQPENLITIKSYGVELALDWRPVDWWRLAGSYAYMEMELEENGSTDINIFSTYDEYAPETIFSIRSQFDLTESIDFDQTLRFVSANPIIDQYHELDLRLSWEVWKNFELQLVGQNLLEQSHPEWRVRLFGATSFAVERSMYAKATWRF